MSDHNLQSHGDKNAPSDADISAVQNHYACIAELDNEELEINLKIAKFYLEIESVGAGMWGDFTKTNELKVMEYQEAVNGPGEESWKKKFSMSTV